MGRRGQKAKGVLHWYEFGCCCRRAKIEHWLLQVWLRGNPIVVVHHGHIGAHGHTRAVTGVARRNGVMCLFDTAGTASGAETATVDQAEAIYFVGYWVVESLRFDVFIHPITIRIASGDSEHHRGCFEPPDASSGTVRAACRRRYVNAIAPARRHGRVPAAESERLSLAKPGEADVDDLSCDLFRSASHDPHSIRTARHRSSSQHTVERWMATWDRDGLGAWRDPTSAPGESRVR